MLETDRACREVQNILLTLAASAALEDRVPARVEAHLQTCRACRLYADGLRTAPLLFARESLYGPALKHRCLAAIAGSAGSGDLKFGLLLAPAIVMAMLMYFVVQVYLVDLTLSRIFGSSVLMWTLSFVAVWTIGAVAGGLCLVVLLRRHRHGNGLREVSHG
ncbi:MAG: hypothetical protein LAP85_27545 [Acidobacteriia bacterium]|nr:hypothetical protein [Terriglobia bacterium]